MRMTRTSRYAIRAVVELARHGDQRVSAETLSRELDLPENYLSKTLHALAREGLLDSNRGPGGGYRLAVPADELPLLRVIEAFETLDASRECVLGREECSEEHPCPVHDEWKDVAAPIVTFFRRTTVGDAVAEDVGERPTAALD
ncbi:MAG: Rrf2 family transcriptional regulator [Candidatus Palauibacterales bacterium]|nr:Rrf2 family transcriptional regulator [Candidatus Palauibacterales bacterium]